MATHASLNVGEWTGFLSAIGGKMKNPSELLKAAFMTAGFQDIIKHFEEEKGPEGKWQARSYFTELAYARINNKFLGNKILQMTGRLKGSILPTNTKKVATNAIEIFANSTYGKIHDEGGKFKAWGKYDATMPKREFMYFSDTAKDRMAQIISSLVFGS